MPHFHSRPGRSLRSASEAIARNPGFAVGFASSQREGIALPLDASLAAGAAAPVHAALPIKRVMPFFANGLLVGVADVDRPHDKLVGLPAPVVGASTIDVGVNEGAIAWAPHGTDSFASLFTIGPDAQAVDALRGVALTMERGFAVTFRARRRDLDRHRDG